MKAAHFLTAHLGWQLFAVHFLSATTHHTTFLTSAFHTLTTQPQQHDTTTMCQPAKKKKKDGPPVKQNTSWSDADKDSVIGQLRNAKADGLMGQGGFKGTVWTDIANSFNDILKDDRSTQSMYGRLKDQFKKFKQLLETSGFGWDPTKKVVTAGQDQWAAIAKVPAYLHFFMTIQVLTCAIEELRSS